MNKRMLFVFKGKAKDLLVAIKNQKNGYEAIYKKLKGGEDVD